VTSSIGNNSGDVAPALAGLSQQQTVNVSSQVTTAALKNVDKAGVQSNAATRSALNFIDGTNASVTVADNSGNDRVDVTVGVVSSPTFSGLTVSGNASVSGSLVNKGGYMVGHPSTQGVWIQTGSGTVSVSDGSGHFYVDITFPTTFATAALSVFCQASVGSGGVTVDVNSLSTTGFQAISPQNGSTFYWFALGY
jgi:hypothetical protein